MTTKKDEMISLFKQIIEVYDQSGTEVSEEQFSEWLTASKNLLGSSQPIYELFYSEQDSQPKKPSVDGLDIVDLVSHIQNKHGVSITTSDNDTLLNMGYYHGYKRYRFVKKANKEGYLPITTFSEIEAIYQFDMALKGLLYPLMMMVETGLKNRVIASLTANSSSGIDDIISNQLNSPSEYDQGTSKYKKAKERYDATKLNIVETVQYYSDKNEVIKHYIDSSCQIPLWAYFEVITLGQFSRFLSCLKKKYQKTLNSDFMIIPDQANAMELVVNAFIDLRNATMHNNAIFDASFTGGVPKVLKTTIKNELGLSQYQCHFIEDYFILLIWVSHRLNVDKEKLLGFIDQFDEITEMFDSNLGNKDILFRIISTNRRNAFKKLRESLS